jgi:hypothetical protein
MWQYRNSTGCNPKGAHSHLPEKNFAEQFKWSEKVLWYKKCQCVRIDKKLSPTLQKPEGFRVQASEGEVVVLYFEPSATQNLESSGFPEGETTWQNRPHPSNSPMEVSKNLSFCYDIGNNCGTLSNLCHVVCATKGLSLIGRRSLFRMKNKIEKEFHRLELAEYLEKIAGELRSGTIEAKGRQWSIPLE